MLALLFAGAVQRHAEAAFVPSQKDEYSVKAAFLYKFAAYVRWPKEAFEDEKSPVIVAVLGADPFGRELDEVFDKKTIQGRSFVLKRYGSKDDVGPCHILFVAKSENARLDSLIETYRSKAVLVIADTDDYAKRGGTMGFALVDKKVRFTINAGACKQARLDVSSQLLKLATVIGDKSTE